MNLITTHWVQDDIKPFQEYLCSFSKGEEKAMWEKRIVNTNMKCLAVPSPVIKKMVNEIAKGNFLEFLDLQIWETLSNTFINAGLICKIKDFSLKNSWQDKKNLLIYTKKPPSSISADDTYVRLVRQRSAREASVRPGSRKAWRSSTSTRIVFTRLFALYGIMVYLCLFLFFPDAKMKTICETHVKTSTKVFYKL